MVAVAVITVVVIVCNSGDAGASVIAAISSLPEEDIGDVNETAVAVVVVVVTVAAAVVVVVVVVITVAAAFAFPLRRRR